MIRSGYQRKRNSKRLVYRLQRLRSSADWKYHRCKQGNCTGQRHRSFGNRRKWRFDSLSGEFSYFKKLYRRSEWRKPRRRDSRKRCLYTGRQTDASGEYNDRRFNRFGHISQRFCGSGYQKVNHQRLFWRFRYKG